MIKSHYTSLIMKHNWTPEKKNLLWPHDYFSYQKLCSKLEKMTEFRFQIDHLKTKSFNSFA